MALRPLGAQDYTVMDMRVPTRMGPSRQPRRWLLPLVLAVLAPAQAGCGSETESHEPRQGLSDTQFREIERLYLGAATPRLRSLAGRLVRLSRLPPPDSAA